MSSEEKKESTEEGVEKPKLIIPPFLVPSTFKKEEKKARLERRLRIRRKREVDEGKAMINPELAKELEIKDKVEIVVVGGGSRERKYIMLTVLNDKVPKSEVWCNEEEMRRLGIADNTIATIRSAK